jgi:hypothetical protein
METVVMRLLSLLDLNIHMYSTRSANCCLSCGLGNLALITYLHTSMEQKPTREPNNF